MTQESPPNWDDRYATEEYVYGREPNDFLRETLPKLRKGRALCLGAGEGRNAVFLARNGFEVTALDRSGVGLEKAKKLAQETGVTLCCIRVDLAHYEIEQDSWDLIVNIFLHLPPVDRRRLYAGAAAGLKQGGSFVLEAYTPEQVNYHTGGPKNVDLLLTLEELKSELSPLQVVHGKELVRHFHEGTIHVGPGAVVQVHAVKRKGAD